MPYGAFPLSQPRNVLGGFRWPGALRLERRVLDRILRSEIGGELVEPPRPSSAPTRSTPANAFFIDGLLRTTQVSHERVPPPVIFDVSDEHDVLGTRLVIERTATTDCAAGPGRLPVTLQQQGSAEHEDHQCK